MILFTDENDENKRLDSFLSEITPELSRSKIQSLIKSGSVKVNGQIKKSSYLLKEGDKIEFEAPPEEDLTIKPQNIPLEIVYEDENMLVVNKPSGMLTHPTAQERENTLVNALLYKYEQNLSDINGEFRRGILHRLDRNTSGLLMIAKNNKAHEYLAEQEKIDYKQPVSKRKIAKKFLLAMLGVAVSSVLLYLILSLYNKIRDGFTTPRTETPPNGETSLVTPDNLIDAVKTFLDKTKWDN